MSEKIETKPVLTEDEANLLQNELKQVEEDIVLLRDELSRKLQHSYQLKEKLGISFVDEVRKDVSDSLEAVKNSQLYNKTASAFNVAKEKSANVLSDAKKSWLNVKNTGQYKSFEDKMGKALTSVKDSLLYAAYGPMPISDDEFEEAIEASDKMKHLHLQQQRDQSESGAPPSYSSVAPPGKVGDPLTSQPLDSAATAATSSSSSSAAQGDRAKNTNKSADSGL